MKKIQKIDLLLRNLELPALGLLALLPSFPSAFGYGW
jgi:hypothetical protein